MTVRLSRPPTAEQRSALDELRRLDLELYQQRVKEFKETVDATIDRAYEVRRRAINDSYQTRIDEEDARQKKALESAIAYFEAFLKKYPDSPPYTPDAMFRLAELYYDISYLRYLDYSDEYGLAQEEGRAGDMPLPEKEFDRSIALFQDLVVRYPGYENVDGAYYLLGYCLKETGREEEARLAWLNLVCPNRYVYDPAAFSTEKAGQALGPDNPSASLVTGAPAAPTGSFVNPFEDCNPVVKNSRFFFESWWLIGNYHFDYDTSQWGVETAIAAYQKLTVDKQHKFYDKGLYKLAWSYYKADRYPEAVRTFSEVVDFSDRQGIRNSSMRPEAIQYLAVCFFTEDWDMDMMPDKETGIQRLQNPDYLPQDATWVREVYDRLGDIYSDNEKHDEAIAIWSLFLEKWPLDKDAPFIQDKIAGSYRTQRKFVEELAARSRLDDYGRDSEWWKANAQYPEAQARVERMAREALITAAITHHQQAQALRAEAKAGQDEEIMAFALEEYDLASRAYRKYLSQNPDTPDAYELNYQLADALFWSEHYPEARAEYAAVRDSNLDDRFREDAARMVIICLERILEQEINKGTITLRQEPPPLEGEPPAPVSQPLPPLLLELMTEREAFLVREPDSKDAATFDYQSAQNYYRYGHWDEARKRYRDIYQKYCRRDEVSIVAWKTLLNMAVEQNDLDAKEQLALLEQKEKCGEGMTAATGGEGIELDKLLGDVAMQRAMTLFTSCIESKDAAVCTEAGDKLVAAVGRAPDHPSADAALHNGALAYENAQRNKTAMELYGRIVDEYPQSQWVDKCLFKQAYSANAFFEYEQALRSYRILADQKRFEKSEYRPDAIMNTALILTNLQDYVKAVPYWKSYAGVASDPAAAVEAAFNAADMHFRARSWNAAIDAYEAFIRNYRKAAGAGPFVVKAAYRIGLCYRNKKRIREEKKTWDRTIAYYNEIVKEPGSMSAEYAAESHFLLIEEDMKKFESFSISGSQKDIDRKMTEGAEKVKELEGRYRDIQKYRRPVWSLAAEFRIGFLYEVLAKAILNIPPPPLDAELQKQLRLLPSEDRELVMMEYEDRFREAMEQHVAKMEERAQAEYVLAITMARQGNLSNEWSLLALERMNAYDPTTYPRQHNGFTGVENNTVACPVWAPEATQ